MLEQDFPYSSDIGISLDEYNRHSDTSILLVDDSELVLISLIRNVKRLGFKEVYATQCDFEAIEFFGKFKPSLITLDVNLVARGNANLMNGFEIAEYCIKINNSSKILFISSMEKSELDRKVRRIRAVHHDKSVQVDYILAKAPNILELNSSIDRVLQG